MPFFRPLVLYVQTQTQHRCKRWRQLGVSCQLFLRVLSPSFPSVSKLVWDFAALGWLKCVLPQAIESQDSPCLLVYRMWHCCSARLWSSLSFYAGSPLWISNAEQPVFISWKCAVLLPSPGWGDLYGPPLHISNVNPPVFISYQDPESRTAIEFGLLVFFKLFFCVCVCLWHVVSLEIHSTLPLFLQQLLDVPQCELCHE